MICIMYAIDLFTDKVAILYSIVSYSYYLMLRGQIHTNLPPKYPICHLKNGNQNCCCIGKKVYYKYSLDTLILYDFLKTLMETGHITSLETSGCLSFHYIANF